MNCSTLKLGDDFGNSRKGEKATNILQTEEGQIKILNLKKNNFSVSQNVVQGIV